MKRFWVGALGIILLGACLLSSCSRATKPRASDFAYADGAFTAVIRGTYTPADGSPRPVAAEVAVGAPNEEGERDLTVTFSEPPALNGVTVSAVTVGAARTVTFTATTAYGAVTSTAIHGELDGFLRFARALLPQGDVTEISPVSPDGTHTVTRRTVAGESAYLFDGTGGLPLQVTVTTPQEILTLTVSGEN